MTSRSAATRRPSRRRCCGCRGCCWPRWSTASPRSGSTGRRPACPSARLGAAGHAAGDGRPAAARRRRAAGRIRRVVPALGAVHRRDRGHLGGRRVATPVEAAPVPGPAGRGQAADIVRRWGADTLAPFALRSDKEWFVTGQHAHRLPRRPRHRPGQRRSGRAAGGGRAVAGEPSWPMPGRGAGAPPSWAPPGGFSSSTGIWGCTRSTTVTRRSSTSTGFSLDGRQMRTVRQAVHRLRAQRVPRRGGHGRRRVPARCVRS